MADNQPIYAHAAPQPLKKNGQPFPKRSPEHWPVLRSVWKGLRKRCTDPKHASYPRYGGRGIKVCCEWSDSFEPFYRWAVANGYSPGLVIDRIDNDGPYSPENCRWATSRENSRNKSNSLSITAFGETKVATDWANDPRCVVSRTTLGRRIAAGWLPERAITELHFVSSSKSDHCRAVSMETYRNVMELVAGGANNVDIARRLCVSDVFVSLARRGKTWHSR